MPAGFHECVWLISPVYYRRVHTAQAGAALRSMAGQRGGARNARRRNAVLEAMTTNLEHPDLAALVRAGDPETIRAVVEAYLPQILRTAQASGLSSPEAEDVTQETFATFLETASRFEGRSHVRTWLFGILHKKISEARRRTKRNRHLDSLEDVFESRFDENGRWLRPPSADSEVLAGEIRGTIGGCLEEVPDQQRMAFTLREVEGLSTPEICKILDVTRTNFGVLLYRARNRLRDCLEQKGIGRNDADLSRSDEGNRDG